MANASDPAKWFGEAEFEYPAGSGRLFKITFNNRALLRAEFEIGKSMVEWLPSLQAWVNGGPPPLVIYLAAIIWGGLSNNHPEITFDDAIDMVMSEDTSLQHAVARALASVEVPEGAVADVGNAPAAGNRQQRRAAKKKT